MELVRKITTSHQGSLRFHQMHIIDLFLRSDSCTYVHKIVMLLKTFYKFEMIWYCDLIMIWWWCWQLWRLLWWWQLWEWWQWWWRHLNNPISPLHPGCICRRLWVNIPNQLTLLKMNMMMMMLFMMMMMRMITMMVMTMMVMTVMMRRMMMISQPDLAFVSVKIEAITLKVCPLSQVAKPEMV